MQTVGRMQQPFDASSPVEIAPGTYWVGKRDPHSIFHSNTYLRVFESNAQPQRTQFNVLIDPGSSVDFAVVAAKTARVLGSLDRISLIHINHQDPDVGSSAPMLLARYAPKAHIFASEDTWRLINHLGLPRERFVAAERYRGSLPLPTGHSLTLVPTPFCHFRGALALYDPQTRVLFSGDLFGGLTTEGELDLDARGEEWPGIRAFHQLYMPAGQALKRAVETIRALTPAVECIAPQHGRILRGDVMHEYLDRMANLPAGLDLIDESADSLQGWTHVLRRLLRVAEELMGPTIEGRLATDASLQDTLEFHEDGPRVTASGRHAIERVLELLTAHETQSIANIIKMEAIAAAEQLQLPMPHVRLDEGDAADVATLR